MSSYSQALSYLNALLNFEQIPRLYSRTWNLKRMRELEKCFAHPERGIFTVVIGGTKGKGSTGFFLSEILRAGGLKVGFYNSPHLEEPRERIWINGKPVSRGDFSEGLLAIKQRLQTKNRDGSIFLTSDAKNRTVPIFSYFEILTLLAALLFKEHRVDVAVYEVGMGGRLDATHTLPAKLVLLTPIHFDHEFYLGNTLTEIAGEKAALLVRGRDAVVAPQPEEVERVIQAVARRRKCPIWSPAQMNGFHPGLLGDFQNLNGSMAVRAAEILRERFHLPVTEKSISEGLKSRSWPGRMEFLKQGVILSSRPRRSRGRGRRISERRFFATAFRRGRKAGTQNDGVPLLLDAAHNPKSIEALCRNLKQLFPGRRVILIFGSSKDKRTDRMIPFLSKVASVCILARAQTPRAKEIPALLEEARGHFPVVIPRASSREALALAREMARPRDLIVVTGSFYLVGEVRALCRK